MGKSQLSLYENGRQAPSFESLMRLLEALELDLHDLHNALQIASGDLDAVCSGKKPPKESGVEIAGRKLAEGILYLLQTSHRSP